MIAGIAVRQDDALLGDVNKVNESGVDYKASAQTDKVSSILSQLGNNEVFHLAELIGYHLHPIVLSDHF